jgi:hypothetical protein
MNGLSWFILNLALLVAAISSRPIMKKLSNPELPPIEQQEKSTRESKTARIEPIQPAHSRTKTKALALDGLWEKSLFCPERTESNLPEGDAGETPAQAAEKSDFELTGIAWIGLPGEVKPVAVIKQQKIQMRPSARTRATGSRGRIPQRTPQQPAPEPEKPQKVIFAEGDLINDTVYTLLEINTKENSAILVRGSERLELKIEFGSDASSERKNIAVTEAANRQKQREQEQKAIAAQHAKPTDQAANAAANVNAGVAGQPPPPPGVDGGIPVKPTTAPQRPRAERITPGSAKSGAEEAIQPPPAVRRSKDEAPSSKQQRLQQLYRESAERRAKKAQ